MKFRASLFLVFTAATTVFSADPRPAPPPVDLAALLAEAKVGFQQPAPDAPPKMMRGAKPAPVSKLLAVPRFPMTRELTPAQFAVVPKRLSMWGNSQYGDCVSAQEAFALAAWSARCLGVDKEVFVPETDLIAWARKYGLLNGADLPQVMDLMAKYGIAVGGVTYKDGAYYSVDYGNVSELQAALYVGPVNIAIDANALPSGAGSKNGWFAVGKGRFPNTDHCVALTGYGRADYLYQQLGVPLPSGLAADKPGYLLFTWNTIGFVDQDWLVSTCTECYVRNPSIVGMTPTPEPTPIPPTPVPVPPGPAPGVGFTGTLTYVNGVLVSVTPGATPVGPSVGLKAELEGAGVNPAIILGVLKLVADVKAKAGFAVILGDVMKIIADLQASPAGFGPRRDPEGGYILPAPAV